MTYTVSSGKLNPTIPYHTIQQKQPPLLPATTRSWSDFYIFGRLIPEGRWLKMMLSIPASPYSCFYITWGIKYVFSRHSTTHFVNYTSINRFSLLKMKVFNFLKMCANTSWQLLPPLAVSTMFCCSPLQNSISRCLSCPDYWHESCIYSAAWRPTSCRLGFSYGLFGDHRSLAMKSEVLHCSSWTVSGCGRLLLS